MQHRTQVAPSVHIKRMNAQGIAKGRRRLVVTTLSQEGHAEVIVGLRVARMKAQRLPARRDRVVQASDFEMDHRQVA